jgi:8-oxo-dGTP diphosphatase
MTAKAPAVAVDCVVFDAERRLLLIRRKREPFAGRRALPGGFVNHGERVAEAALRELREETAVEGRNPRLIGVYSDPHRDPRGHVISVAFLVDPATTRAIGGGDAASAAFVANWQEEALAFDHNQIVADALRLLREA